MGGVVCKGKGGAVAVVGGIVGLGWFWVCAALGTRQGGEQARGECKSRNG